MKPLLYIFTLTLIAFSSLSLAASERSVPDYPVDKLDENLYVIHGPLAFPSPENQGFMNNPAFIITQKSVIVVDPGGTLQVGEMLLRAIKKITSLPITTVFNTHIHGDHWLGNQAIKNAYPNVTIYGHSEMIKNIDDGEGLAWVELMDRATKGASKGTKVTPPTQAVKHNDQIKVDGLTFRIHHYGQAHTKTDIMIEVTELSAIFLGDNVLYKRLPSNLAESDILGLINTIDAALNTASKHYIHGHGPSGNHQGTRLYKTYLTTLYNTVKKLYNQDMSDFEMKPRVHLALKAYHDWVGYEDELGRHISIAYLQVEAAEF